MRSTGNHGAGLAPDVPPRAIFCRSWARSRRTAVKSGPAGGPGRKCSRANRKRSSRPRSRPLLARNPRSRVAGPRPIGRAVQVPRSGAAVAELVPTRAPMCAAAQHGRDREDDGEDERREARRTRARWRARAGGAPATPGRRAVFLSHRRRRRPTSSSETRARPSVRARRRARGDRRAPPPERVHAEPEHERAHRDERVRERAAAAAARRLPGAPRAPTRRNARGAARPTPAR